jgi:hypothetical protein
VAIPTEDPALAGLEPQARARIDTILSRRWSLPGEHPLARLHGAALGDYRLLALLGPKNNVGSRYYQLWLADADGLLSGEPLVLGLHNTGRFPAFNWIELTQYREVLRVGDDVIDLRTTELDRPLFKQFAQFVPPGGHIMVEYDSPSHRATERILTLGYPAACSPVGYLMFGIGCRSYRDWYISEGGREGPRKLQGFMPLNDEVRREKEARLREELTAFLARTAGGSADEWAAVARRTAQEILLALEATNHGSGS